MRHSDDICEWGDDLIKIVQGQRFREASFRRSLLDIHLRRRQIALSFNRLLLVTFRGFFWALALRKGVIYLFARSLLIWRIAMRIRLHHDALLKLFHHHRLDELFEARCVQRLAEALLLRPCSLFVL